MNIPISSVNAQLMTLIKNHYLRLIASLATAHNNHLNCLTVTISLQHLVSCLDGLGN